jgi:hypothetical protein
MRAAFLLSAALMLTACATPYTENGMGFTGGVEAQMITDDTARISARGNAYTDQARIEDFVLLKSAQTALDHDFTHPGTMQTNVYGSTAFTTYSPGMVHNFVKPGEDIFVRFCKGNCQSMLPAQQVVDNLGPKYLPKSS